MKIRKDIFTNANPQKIEEILKERMNIGTKYLGDYFRSNKELITGLSFFISAGVAVKLTITLCLS